MAKSEDKRLTAAFWAALFVAIVHYIAHQVVPKVVAANMVVAGVSFVVFVTVFAVAYFGMKTKR